MANSYEPHYPALRKARALATELRCVLEEVYQDANQDPEFDDEDVYTFMNSAEEIEGWLDDLNMGEEA